MPEPTTQPIEHCPRFPEHCSLECMERMRAQFGSYALNEPPFEDWCLMAQALRRQEKERRRFETEQLKALHRREFPEDPGD
ncbi:MAG: hypothetical protein RLZZ255_714 [Cyanobacteriota bacterium]